MKRLFERKEREGGVNAAERIKIGVTGLGSGAGASFAAVSAAYFASKDTKFRTAFVQLDGDRITGPGNAKDRRRKCDVYDSLGMDKRFAGRQFTDILRAVSEGKNIRGLRNDEEGINWAIEVPGDIDGRRKKHIDELGMMRLINNISGDIVICDLGSIYDFRQRAERVISDMDTVICVIDPIPSKLLAEEESIEFLRSLEVKGYNIVWLMNKYNQGINRRELRDFFSAGASKNFASRVEKYSIPLLPQEIFYNSQYNCSIPAAAREISTVTEKVFVNIIKEICCG